MRKLLFRSRSGEGYPMVIAVTLCLLMLFMVIAEYFRVNIIVQGVRDAVQQAVIATVNENYDDVYHSVREGYAAGWFPEGDGEWFESIDAGDIYGNLSYILGLTTDGDGYMKYAGNELEYTLSDLSVHMLSNERYCGDAILQKSVTIDCIEKKRKKNTGEAPMYYVQNNHPAIIDRVTFNKVQEELARRKTKTPGSAKSSITSTGKYSRYALTDVLICGNCGTRYRRVTWSRNGVKRIVWRCISRLDYGKKYCSDSPTIMEDKLQEAIVRAVNKFNEQDNATYKALMRATISEALGLNGDPEEVDMLERKVEALNNKMLALVNESVSSGDGIEAHESEFMTLSQETELLKQRIAAIQESTAKDNGEQSRLEQIQAIISERESKCMEYDDSIVRQMVECIKVYPGGKLEIIFGGGYLVEESV